MTGLETILQRHQEGTWNEDADDNLTFGCDCGQRSEPFPNTSARISTDNVKDAGEWHRAHVADQIRGWLLSEAQKFDPSDDYHQTRADETDLNARAYYAGIDRVCALIEGRISTWTDAPTIAYELDDQTTTQEQT